MGAEDEDEDPEAILMSCEPKVRLEVCEEALVANLSMELLRIHLAPCICKLNDEDVEASHQISYTTHRA